MQPEGGSNSPVSPDRLELEAFCRTLMTEWAVASKDPDSTIAHTIAGLAFSSNANAFELSSDKLFPNASSTSSLMCATRLR
jgi:hypothetical protein